MSVDFKYALEQARKYREQQSFVSNPGSSQDPNESVMLNMLEEEDIRKSEEMQLRMNLSAGLRIVEDKVRRALDDRRDYPWLYQTAKKD